MRISFTVNDLTLYLAAEQKARTTYDNLLRIIEDPDISSASAKPWKK